MMLIFISSCLLFTFTRFELCDNIVMFCDDINNYAVEICNIVDVTHTNSKPLRVDLSKYSFLIMSGVIWPEPQHQNTHTPLNTDWHTLFTHTHCYVGQIKVSRFVLCIRAWRSILIKFLNIVYLLCQIWVALMCLVPSNPLEKLTKWLV